LAKNKKHIDDLFKDNLQGSQMPLDGSEWNRLFDDLHPKKKRRFAWWWFAIGILLVSAISLFYVQSQKPTSAQIVQSENIDTRLEDNLGENIEDEVLESIDNSDEKKEKREEKREERRKNRIENRKENIDKRSQTSKAESASTKSNVQSNNAKTKENVVSQTVQATTAADIVSMIMKGFNPFRLEQNFGEITMRSTVESNAVPLIYIYPMEDLIDTLDPITKFIDPYVGISLGGSRLNQQLSSSIQNYTKLRNANESAGILPNIGFDIGAGYKGLEIASGIKYLEKGQQSNPNYTYEKYDSIRRINGTNDTTYLRWNFRDTTVNGVPSPRYRYVSVPISIGKQIVNTEKFDLTLGVTSNIQILAGGTGTIINSELSLMNVQGLEGLNRLSLTYGGYISVGYALNDRMKLKLLTRFDADALDMMKHTDISQKMNGVGADLSLQFKLKK
jgi:hypothetical protein